MPFRSARRAAPLALLLLAACGGDGPATATDPSGTTTDNGAGNGAITLPVVPAPNMAGRGELVSSSAGPRVPKLLTTAVLFASGASRAFTARYDAQPYVIRYRTPGVDGRLTTASGAVWLPAGATGPLPVVVYMHGTVTKKTAAPSYLLQTPEGDVFGSSYATDGSVLVEPDYLGLGVAGDGTFHPYLHVQTEASAAVDLLRAVRTLATQQGLTLDARGVFVTGYSQGGGAAMGLFRTLERDYATEFPVLGAAPMSGPYDLSGTSRTMLQQNPDYHAAAVYTAYLIATLDTLYAIAPRLDGLLAVPNDRIAAHLRDGVATDQELSALPSHPRDVLRADVVAAMLADPNHAVWRAARDNDTYDWTPRAPVRLYYGGADRDVPKENALTAAARMQANGAASVAAVNVGASLDHAGAVLPATIAGKLFLDSLRRR